MTERKLLQIIAMEVALLLVALGWAYVTLRDSAGKIDGTIDKIKSSSIFKFLKIK